VVVVTGEIYCHDPVVVGIPPSGKVGENRGTAVRLVAFCCELFEKPAFCRQGPHAANDWLFGPLGMILWRL